VPLVFLQRFDSVPEAELVCNLLKGSGVECLLQKDGIPGSTGAVQGAYLLVPEKELESARMFLEEK